jgi:hypothetical protein
MIDVHVIHLPGENQEWWKLCEKSLEDHPITLHHVDGYVGDIVRGRFEGFSKGTSDYVSFVDPDDIIKPGVFQKCLEEITPEVCGVYTLSEVVVDDRVVGLMHPYRKWNKELMLRSFTEVHQIAVMHREMINKILYENKKLLENHSHNLSEILTYSLLAKEKPWKALDFIGYQWRKHNNGGHTKITNSDKVGLKMKEILGA